MPRLPRISGKQLIRALERAGFVVIRIRGSHHVLRHPDGRTTVIPVHSSEPIGPGLLTKVLAAAEIEPDTLRSLL